MKGRLYQYERRALERSDDTTVRRVAGRASYDRADADAILDEGLVAHVGLVADGRPIVIPMLFARAEDEVVLHASVASRIGRSLAAGVDVCVTVTLLDGVVLARSAFHHSVNYRSVVLLGRAMPVDDDSERRRLLDVLVDHVVPGRVADARPPNRAELRQTHVLTLPIGEGSVKIRRGGPLDDEEDLDLAVWAGVVPLEQVAGTPVPDAGVAAPAPSYAANYRRTGT